MQKSRHCALCKINEEKGPFASCYQAAICLPLPWPLPPWAQEPAKHCRQWMRKSCQALCCLQCWAQNRRNINGICIVEQLFGKPGDAGISSIQSVPGLISNYKLYTIYKTMKYTQDRQAEVDGQSTHIGWRNVQRWRHSQKGVPSFQVLSWNAEMVQLSGKKMNMWHKHT